MLDRRTLMLGASAGLVAGCAEGGNVGTGDVFDGRATDAVLMMRVRALWHHPLAVSIPSFNPSSGQSARDGGRYTREFLPQCIDEASIDRNGVCRPWYSNYIVHRAPAGDYHIATVTQTMYRSQTVGRIDPGQGFPKRYAFRLVPGRVNYLGDFLVEYGTSSFRFTNAGTGIELARQRLVSRFPKITADIVANFPTPRVGPA